MLLAQHPRTVSISPQSAAGGEPHREDGGREIIAGNEKVIAARLSDAKFFWEQDLKKPLDEMAVALGGITFHEKLGSQKERVERVAELAFQIAGSVDAVPEDARRAAQLAKADLVSGMVGEFPELQGLMAAPTPGCGRQARESRAPLSCTTAQGPQRYGAAR